LAILGVFALWRLGFWTLTAKTPRREEYQSASLYPKISWTPVKNIDNLSLYLFLYYRFMHAGSASFSDDVDSGRIKMGVEV
jgi:hypothetical protein